MTRTVCTSALTLYIDPAGSDSNDGSAAHPFQHIQYGIKRLYNDYDFQGFIPSLQLANGLYYESLAAGGALLDALEFYITGTACGAVLISDACLQMRNGATCTVQGVKFQSMTNNGGIALSASQNGTIDFLNCEFGYFVNGQHIVCDVGGKVNNIGAYAISGNAANHVLCAGGAVNLAPSTITVSPSLAIGIFAKVQGPGKVQYGGVATYTNAIAGQTYDVEYGGNLLRSGTTVPGSTAGYCDGRSTVL